jgi:small subunit ribosomal protein S17
MAEKRTTKTKKQKTDTVSLGIATRGRIFQGTVTKVFDTRVVVEFERTVKIQKYERFMRKKTRLHARLPQDMRVAVGDYVRVRECRPLSKIIHFVVLDVVRPATEVAQ